MSEAQGARGCEARRNGGAGMCVGGAWRRLAAESSSGAKLGLSFLKKEGNSMRGHVMASAGIK